MPEVAHVLGHTWAWRRFWLQPPSLALCWDASQEMWSAGKQAWGERTPGAPARYMAEPWGQTAWDPTVSCFLLGKGRAQERTQRTVDFLLLGPTEVASAACNFCGLLPLLKRKLVKMMFHDHDSIKMNRILVGLKMKTISVTLKSLCVF